MTIPYSNKTVYVAAQTAEGALQREIERYLDAQPNRNNVTWSLLRTHIQTSFLSAHEEDRLRDEVDKTKQNAYEGTASYGRRFSDVCDLAYPADNRNPDQHRVMKIAYMKGLRDSHLVERLVKEGKPDTFLQAMNYVAQYTSDDYILNKALEGASSVDISRQEEPMEVGAVSQEISQEMAELRRLVNGMTKQLTRLTAATGMRGPPAPPKRNQGDAGKSLCFFYSMPGHFKHECKELKKLQTMKRAPVQPPRLQGGQ